MIEHRKIVRLGLLATVVGGSLSSCGTPNLVTILKQDCNYQNTENIGNIPVASEKRLLENGSKIQVGLDVSLTGTGNGKLSVNGNVNLLPDEEIIIEDYSGTTIFSKTALVLIRASNQSGKTLIQASMNCKDPSAPPPENNNSGFSPSKNSKIAPTAYRGFGNR